MSLTTLTSSSVLLFILVLLVPLAVTTTSACGCDSEEEELSSYPVRSVQDVLRSYGLPAGLFPESIKSYTLDHTTGLLEVHMHGPCMAQYETRVFFDSVVKANLTYGQMKVLQGMAQEELFLWFPVKDILVTDPKSGLIVIDIGLAFKHLSLSRFDEPPVCRSKGYWVQIGGRKGLGLFLELI